MSTTEKKKPTTIREISEYFDVPLEHLLTLNPDLKQLAEEQSVENSSVDPYDSPIPKGFKLKLVLPTEKVRSNAGTHHKDVRDLPPPPEASEAVAPSSPGDAAAMNAAMNELMEEKEKLMKEAFQQFDGDVQQTLRRRRGGGDSDAKDEFLQPADSSSSAAVTRDHKKERDGLKKEDVSVETNIASAFLSFFLVVVVYMLYLWRFADQEDL